MADQTMAKILAFENDCHRKLLSALYGDLGARPTPPTPDAERTAPANAEAALDG